MLKNFILQFLNIFYPLVKKILPFQIYAYLVVGAANTLLNVVLFMLYYQAFSTTTLGLEAATGIAFIITVLTGFWLQKNFAFTDAGNEKKDVIKQFSKYAIVALQGQLSAYLLTKGMIILLKMSGFSAYILTAIIMLTLNYFLQKYFTFKKRRSIVS